MHYVYIIQSIRSGKYYIGSTENLERRLENHNINQVRSTKYKGPYILVYREQLDTKTEARKREDQLKKYKGSESLKRLIKRATPSSSLV